MVSLDEVVLMNAPFHQIGQAAFPQLVSVAGDADDELNVYRDAGFHHRLDDLDLLLWRDVAPLRGGQDLPPRMLNRQGVRRTKATLSKLPGDCNRPIRIVFGGAVVDAARVAIVLLVGRV